MSLLNSLLLSLLFSNIVLAGSIATRTSLPVVDTPRFLPPTGSTGSNGGSTGTATDSLELLDIALVASVDGKFHALDRNSGRVLWSMTSTTSSPSALAPLVRTSHVELDGDDEDEEQEQYIIEPQSGDIYVLSSPTAALQRLPFSMASLVEMSPFSFSSDDDRRVFVGKKETTLLVLELETGKLQATINSECPWEADVQQSPLEEIDLDELEDASIPPRSAPTTVFIGRTDYHVSIHSPPLPGSAARPPIQNLSFSTYGPNNQDAALQALYRRTPDDTYIQSLPTGQVIAVQTRTGNDDPAAHSRSAQDQIRWGHTFTEPIVAVFDVVRQPSRAPFVLLQPHPRLEDVLGKADLGHAMRAHQFPHLDAAYVGLVGRSLFAMSPDRFPLVIFSDSARARGHAGLGGSGDGGHTSENTDLDLPPADRSRGCWRDPACLTGVRSLQHSSRSRLSRLLDAAVPSAPAGQALQQHKEQGLEHDSRPRHHHHRTGTWNNINASTRGGGGGAPPSSMRGSVGAGVLLIGASAAQGGMRLAPWALLAAFAVLCAWGYKRGLVVTPGAWGVGIVSPSVAPVGNEEKVHAVSEEVRPLPPVLVVEDKKEEDVNVADLPRTPKSAPAPLVSPDSPETERRSDEGEDASGSGANPAAAAAGKKRVVRRRRGKKKKTVDPGAETVEEGGEEEDETAPVPPQQQTQKLATPAKKPKANGGVVVSGLVLPPEPVKPPSLVVSDEILGFGSHGTVVYKGSLQGRAVAVKRLLQDFTTLASREVSILQESDDHPNVIRYYYQEAQANFLYIALELCPASLADIVERPDAHAEIVGAFDAKRALRQITAGVRHLHALKIVHRDIKPQNILVAANKTSASSGRGNMGGYRMLISDFGLCRKLEVDQTSFLPTAHGAGAAGTVGWRAPEILRGEVSLEEPGSGDDSSSRGSVATVNGSSSASANGSSTSTHRPTRLTKSVDIFALGCLFYYTLTNGGHPFGDRYERDVNIIRDQKALDGLDRFGEEGAEAVDLISAMLDPEAKLRPDTSTCLLHPFFWDSGRRLTFLQDASDRFEIMCRDPRDAMLVALERGAVGVVGNDWAARLDRVFLDNLGKFRKYDGKSIQDLMRALRNKKHHYQDLPDNVKRHVGPMPDGFLAYFTRRFPRLFLHVYGVVGDSYLRHESMFRSYFELQE